MILYKNILVSLFIFFITLWMVGKLRQLFLKKQILDIPNERSSHHVPTARGGGIAIVISFCLSLLWCADQHLISWALFFAFMIGGLIVALIGYIDDMQSLSAGARFMGQLLAASIATYFLGGFPVLDIGLVTIHLGIGGYLLEILSIVWLTNLYNFMDGIDGLAAGEALFVSLAAAFGFYFLGDGALLYLSLFLSASVAGFLCWNWPPAKIFLGDVGSGFLGYVFGVLLFASINQHHVSPFFWLTLLAVFIFDASFTLCYRISRGEKWYSAHRLHVYQQCVQRGNAHQTVTLTILALNIFLLAPLSYWILIKPHAGFMIFMILMVMSLLTWRLLFKSEQKIS